MRNTRDDYQQHLIEYRDFLIRDKISLDLMGLWEQAEDIEANMWNVEDEQLQLIENKHDVNQAVARNIANSRLNRWL